MSNPNHGSVPKPHDPREVEITPQAVVEKLDEILSKPTATLADEATQLQDAHEVLQQALR